MSNETKRDVFLQIAKENRDFRMYDPEGCEPKELIELDYQDWIREYDAAFPDDMPVVSKEVSNIMITYRFLWWKEFLDKAYDNELDKELSNDEDINYKVRSESAEVARALILGAWHIEEPGEIVKLK